MKALIPTSADRKDVRRTAKRGYDLAKLDAVLKLLQAGDALPPSNRAHPLKGDWKVSPPARLATDLQSDGGRGEIGENRYSCRSVRQVI